MNGCYYYCFIYIINQDDLKDKNKYVGIIKTQDNEYIGIPTQINVIELSAQKLAKIYNIKNYTIVASQYIGDCYDNIKILVE